MVALALIARLVLAAVFAVAGATKLADRPGTRKAAVDFGAPERFAAPIAVLLPLAELAVAALLVFPSTAVAGAVGALALLALFTVAISASLLRGQAPDCHCFGQLHSAPASWKTLARNGVLAALAVVALVEPSPSATDWLGRLEGAELVALAIGVAAATLLAVGVFAFVTLMRSYGSVLIRLDRIESALAAAGIEGDIDVVEEPEFGREPGTPAPAFATTSVTGEAVTLDSLLAPGLPALLLFTSPHCGPCKTLVPMAAEWQREYADQLTIAFAGDGAADELRAEAEELELANALVDTDGSLYRAYEANGTPSAVVIAPDGSMGSWVAAGSDSIERLVARTLAPEPAEAGLPVGAEAPALELPSLDGETVSLETLRGRETLLLFWNPDCGFCRSMHEDLLARETSTNGGTPRLVVVSSGDAESSRAEGFRSLVLLDEGFTAGTAFGIDGTPMAVLLDADGRVASSVAAGADAVLELAD